MTDPCVHCADAHVFWIEVTSIGEFPEALLARQVSPRGRWGENIEEAVLCLHVTMFKLADQIAFVPVERERSEPNRALHGDLLSARMRHRVQDATCLAALVSASITWRFL